MSITRDRGKVIFECDNCHDTEESEEDETFNMTWERLKEAGWSARKVNITTTQSGTDWLHFHDDQCLAVWERSRR